MKPGDPIWILYNNNTKTVITSTISKLGSKWGYFKLYPWSESKFCKQNMELIDHTGSAGDIFLSEKALNEHLQKEKLIWSIKFNILSHQFTSKNYSLEALLQITTLLKPSLINDGSLSE
jgi:hypothetical protein